MPHTSTNTEGVKNYSSLFKKFVEFQLNDNCRPRAADRVRLIERLAVQIDQLDHKIQLATQKLNMDDIKADR